MCDLDSFHLLTVDDQMRVLERMLADRRDDERARAERFARTPSPAPASPSRDALLIPSPGLAGVGDSLTENEA